MNFDLEKLSAVAKELSDFERDCAITVALKITDDSCKMDEEQRALFMALYDALPEQSSDLFSPTVFSLIEIGRNDPSAFIFSEIKQLREMAMDDITRPKMKSFKAEVRKRYSA
jgi:hypothetical protein